MVTIISIIQRLAAGEWFTARVSSCGLFHIAYPSAPETIKTELRTIYNQLCQDDMPMVRRSAASNLGKFAATVEAAHLKTEVMSIFEDLTQDGMSSWIFWFPLFNYISLCLLLADDVVIFSLASSMNLTLITHVFRSGFCSVIGR